MLKDLLLRVLNQSVGEFFENIDASQLQLSVFSGNIALNNLTLKQNVCNGLGLPFRVIAGKCANLSLRIPWTGLWSSPVEVTLKDLYLLIVPGSSFPYDEEMEEKARLRLKLQLLENIEAAQKELTLVNSQAAEPGYIQKLTIQTLKNLQIRIEAIHIRYEDDETNPGKNFAIGCALSSLSILTTDSSWTPRYVSDNAPTLHKLLSLEGFALYCNSNSLMVSKLHKEVQEIVDHLQRLLKSSKFDYLFGPISITTKLSITSNPEKGPKPFAIPKMLVETVIEELALGFSNLQYQDILHLAISWEFMFRKQHYRKYRPHTKQYRGYYRLWWKFAYECILEDIQRKRNNWRWIRMKHHRRDCKAYYRALFKKTMRRVSNLDLESEIERLENNLDIFNILLIRKQIDLCRQRREYVELKLRSEQGWGSWFKSWVATTEVISPVTHSSSLSEYAEPITPDEMTPEEKRSIIVAIGFSDATPTPTTTYPPEYVDCHVDFRLDKLKIIITQDDRHWNSRRSQAEGYTNTILDLQITRCELTMDTRPAKPNGLKVVFQLESINAYGGDAPEGEEDETETIPHIIAPRREVGQGMTSLLEILFEVAPLNSEFNQCLKVHGRPLDITFDADTVRKLVMCFSLPKKLNVQRLQSKAMLTYSQLKSRSSYTFQKLMEHQDLFELDIRLEAPCIIVPLFSQATSTRINVIVVELGELIISSQLIDTVLPNSESSSVDAFSKF